MTFVIKIRVHFTVSYRKNAYAPRSPHCPARVLRHNALLLSPRGYRSRPVPTHAEVRFFFLIFLFVRKRYLSRFFIFFFFLEINLASPYGRASLTRKRLLVFLLQFSIRRTSSYTVLVNFFFCV